MKTFQVALCLFFLSGCYSQSSIRTEGSYVKPSPQEESGSIKVAPAFDCDRPSSIDATVQLKECHKISLQEIKELEKEATQQTSKMKILIHKKEPMAKQRIVH